MALVEVQKQPHYTFDVTVTFIGLCVSVPTSPLEPEHKEDPIYNEDVDNEVSFLEVKDLSLVTEFARGYLISFLCFE